MSGPYRLAEGGHVDRSRELKFRFDDVVMEAYPGDTLASALLANGVRLVGRSFKYHRPRGVVTAGVDEPNALVQVAGRNEEPNVRATVLPVVEGLSAKSINRWPGLRFDVGALNGVLARFLSAGFYYKTFIGGFGWNVYGPIIRRFAGLGSSPSKPDNFCYEKRFAHCDVLIVGAGPAGLVAAERLAQSGLRILLVDDQPEVGGQLIVCDAEVDGERGVDWARAVARRLDAADNVTRLANTSASGYYDHNFVTLLEQPDESEGVHERLWKVRARRVVLACGATERPLVFADNDRPGVMQLYAALVYAKRFGVMVGTRAVVVTNNGGAMTTVTALAALGLEIAAVVDMRASDSADTDPAGDHPWPLLRNHTIERVCGRNSVTGVVVRPLEGGTERTLDCDVMLMSGGWNPLVHLSSHAGAKPVYSPELATFVPGPSAQAEITAGAMRGLFDLSECLADGVRAATLTAQAFDSDLVDLQAPQGSSTPELALEACWHLPKPAGAKAFVDFQNDVLDDDIAQAAAESFVSVEHMKRYTTTGMGTDQGKLGNANAIGLLAEARGIQPDEVGTTTYRPPYTPVSFGAITGKDVGELTIPARRTALTDWIEQHGASMFEAGGNYRRPLAFLRDGEDLASAIAREAVACRTSAGIYDGSPLGKFELSGRDVVTFLERLYTNRWADLAVGQGRFGLMLREDGRLLDDGVTFRLAEHRYWMFCGTGAADHMQMYLERLLSLEWPELDVHLVRVTTQWTNVCVCGPHARNILERAGTDIDLRGQALPFMGLREGTLAGLPVRLARVGYTGELSFEANVPAVHGLALWEALMEAGAAFDITPIGSEASMLMRCEKGFVSAGYESDGTVNPYDAGLGWAVDETKDDFIGKRSLMRDRNVGGVRQSVVGLKPFAPDFVPPDGTPILDGRLPDGSPNVVGYVTQGVFSPNLNEAIAMAVMDNGRQSIGQTVTLAAVKRSGPARVVAPCFIDPKGQRMRST